MTAPEDVLARLRLDADALKRHGDARLAASLERAADEIEQAVTPLLEWLSEDRACTRSGHDARWFQRRRAAWAARGLARETATGWQYRAAVVPDAGRVAAPADALVDRLLRAS